jgi:magnesium-protoporphyrin IX monomethyl ester (oxidative) cyclase
MKFVLQVYVTMYLNDCQRTDFYEGIGLNTKEFDMHVIIEVSLCLHIHYNRR